MKKLKNNKKFSFLEEYKKSMQNPLIEAYKVHLNLLQECYIEILKKNKELKKLIENQKIIINQLENKTTKIEREKNE